MAKLTLGNALTPHTRSVVLRLFVYRQTTENGYPARNPCKATVPPISDSIWLATHAFYVRADGTLDNRYNHCEPYYMAEEE